MDRMRSWNSSEYESCGLQPYEISNRGRREEREEKRRKEKKKEGKGKKTCSSCES